MEVPRDAGRAWHHESAASEVAYGRSAQVMVVSAHPTAAATVRALGEHCGVAAWIARDGLTVRV